MPSVSPNAEAMPRSGIRRVMDAAWQSGRPVIGMHVGEPSFAPPPHVVDAAMRAYADGETHYVSNAGIPRLREAIAGKLAAENGIEASSEQVIVTAGGAQALHLAFSLVLRDGDEVLIPDPGWPNFAMAIGLVQATPVRYRLDPDHGFMPSIEELEARVTERTRMIVVNSPSNPLGTVFPAELMEQLVRFAERRGIWLLSDECYDAITHGAEHVSPARFDTQGVVLSAFSFSKSFAMTGIRVGYLVCPPAVAPVAAKLQEALIACVNAPAQAAALAALEGGHEHLDEMKAAYTRRLALATGLLDELGIPYLRPQGAFYLWVDVSGIADAPVADWALRLLAEQDVAVAPGTAFGDGGEGWIRLSLAVDDDGLAEGISRIGAMRA